MGWLLGWLWARRDIRKRREEMNAAQMALRAGHITDPEYRAVIQAPAFYPKRQWARVVAGRLDFNTFHRRMQHWATNPWYKVGFGPVLIGFLGTYAVLVLIAVLRALA